MFTHLLQSLIDYYSGKDGYVRYEWKVLFVHKTQDYEHTEITEFFSKYLITHDFCDTIFVSLCSSPHQHDQG